MNVADIKQNNRNKIYFYLREKGFATKQKIAYDLQLSLPTISRNLEYLVNQGLLSSDDKVENKTGGRNPIAYSYIADAKVAIGLDITKHNISCVILDLNGNIIKHLAVKQDFERSDEYLKLLGEIVETIVDDAKIDRKKILGVGIGVPGLVEHDEGRVIYGKVIDNENMDCDEYAKYIPYPSKLIHDLFASGFAESWRSPQPHNTFYMSLCNSVGGFILVDGNLYMGDGFYSGEVGHMMLVPGGDLCYCGQRGCVDAYCNAEVLSKHTDGDLKLFFDLLKQKKDAKLQKVWEQYLDYLSEVTNNIRMLFGCEIIIGGYVGAYIREDLDLLCKKVDERNPFGEKASEYLLPCKAEMESVASGAGLLFIDEFLKISRDSVFKKDK